MRRECGSTARQRSFTSRKSRQARQVHHRGFYSKENLHTEVAAATDIMYIKSEQTTSKHGCATELDTATSQRAPSQRAPFTVSNSCGPKSDELQHQQRCPSISRCWSEPLGDSLPSNPRQKVTELIFARLCRGLALIPFTSTDA